jgi:hypothetical protein
MDKRNDENCDNCVRRKKQEAAHNTYGHVWMHM